MQAFNAAETAIERAELVGFGDDAVIDRLFEAATLPRKSRFVR